MNEKRATEWGEKLRALLGKKNAVMLLGIAGIARIGLSELWSDSAARAIMIPSAPVSSMSFSPSETENTPPLAMTGIFTADFAAAISLKFTSPE